ncbi:response regulator [candidate division KSB3 bacterium]|uniref:histidine kinase n=1 Tax=candidate division KSB3 bacterium TaxID=2044937 RepID=A0A9D5JZ81_9BACT|nr:response regulator [candidate division KSB3 bacterium]MBD3326944.1 response regulator [candidate division KSB3 bacterium]
MRDTPMSENGLYSILIVDDNHNNLFTLRTLLESALDADVIEADSGVKALEQVSTQKIDLILLDIQMPELNGFQVAELIRKRKKFQHIPIIFLTAVYKSEEFKQQGLRGGAIDYLTKPIDDAILLNRVKAYLRLIEGERALNRQLQQINVQLQQEIEERKRTEQALQAQSAFLQTLIDTIPSPIFYKDTDLRYRGCNQAFEDYLGTTKEAIIGKSVYDLSPEDLAEKYEAMDADLLRNPGVQHYEASVKHSDGSRRDVLFNKATFNNVDGTLGGLVGVLVDITHRKQAEQELERLNQQLREASRQKSDFLAKMSHELRTPLNAVIGYTSLSLSALKEQVAAEDLTNLVKAERSARALLQLINNVLDFSKIEAGQMETFLEEIDLEDILEEIVITAEGLILDKPLELKYELAPDLPLVETDYTKVKQVLSNLVGNAIKFTTEGYVAVRAAVVDQSKGKVVRIEVEDTGEGIPQDKLANVFQSFKQADKSTAKKFGGSGLGLAISKSFCDMLGIELGVESEPGRGTTFWLHIPIHPAHDAHQPAASPASLPDAQAADAAGQLGDQPTDDNSILVIDDDENNLMLMDAIFRRAGYRVYKAQDGQEGIEIANTMLPDVVLVDLDMPILDGFQVTQHLKQEPATTQIPIIACTALAIQEAEEKAFEVGCTDFIRKPVEPDHLLRYVSKAVVASKKASLV